MGGAGLAVNKSLKRRTWHVDRVVRVVALEEEDEETSSLPSFARSTSSDNYQSSGTLCTCTCYYIINK